MMVLLVAGFWLVAPVIALVRIAGLQRELRELQGRFDALRRAVARLAVEPGRSPAPETSDAMAELPPPLPASAAPAVHTEPAAASDVVPRAIVPTPVHVVPAAPAPALVEDAPAGPPRAASEGLEDLVGSVWLQNAGAVVLLLGVFFFILWGYSTGRFGPGALVVAGIAIGLLSAWRGDRLARSLPRLGHTFIGIGLGIVYLSLYLGHFTLHVLPQPLALALLLLTSFVAVGAGLRYGVQAIAAIGVTGAFLPQLLVTWLSLRGFSLESGALLGYLAIVDVLVFALAARAGWSGLDLAALALTALTWLSSYPQGDWGWGTTAALALLFTGLGLAPLPRLTRVEGSVRPIDLSVVAGAPVALILSVWAWCTRMPSPSVAMLWFGLAGLHLAAALWVDTRRSERDLWRPLTGAAIVFFTAGLQRLVGSENLALTWCIEGVLLVVLGLAPRSGWLRLCGHAITWLAGLVVLTDPAWWSDASGVPALIHLGALRELGIIVVLFVGAHLLARRREQLLPLERWIPEAWTFFGSLLLMVWSWRRCHELAYMTELPAGSWWQGSWPPATQPAVRQARWFTVLLGVAWTAQAAVFAWLGARSGRVLQRVCAYGAGLFAFGALLVALLSPDVWSHGQWPVLHPEGLGVLAGLLLAVVMVVRLASRRHELTRLEHRAPEACATALLLLTLLWTAREADHVTRMVMETGAGLPGVPGNSGPDHRMLAAALTSAAWLIEALVLLALGWMRSTAFLRWAGLVLIGVTMLKFAFYDLASADVFWRFLTAIAAGAAMMAVSFAYQRRAKARRTRA